MSEVTTTPENKTTPVATPKAATGLRNRPTAATATVVGLKYFAKNAEHMAHITTERETIANVCDAIDKDAKFVKVTTKWNATDKGRNAAIRMNAAGRKVVAVGNKFEYEMYAVQFSDDTLIPMSTQLTKDVEAAGGNTDAATTNNAGELTVNIMKGVNPEGYPYLRVAKVGEPGLTYEIEVLGGEAATEG